MIPAVEAKASFRVVESFRAYLGDAGKDRQKSRKTPDRSRFPPYDIMQRIGRCDNLTSRGGTSNMKEVTRCRILLGRSVGSLPYCRAGG
jgi:hypothetical protein